MYAEAGNDHWSLKTGWGSYHGNRKQSGKRHRAARNAYWDTYFHERGSKPSGQAGQSATARRLLEHRLVIVEHEQNQNVRAEYGKEVLKQINYLESLKEKE